MSDENRWVIEGKSEEDRIESAVNMAIGMSLVHDVTISVEPATNEEGQYQVSARAGNGDTGLIECLSEEQAGATRDTIFQRIKEDLAKMPPYGGRRSISVRA